MMRSPRFMAIACRAPNGEILTKVEELERHWLFRQKWLKLPFLRGTLAILDSMVIGNRSLKYSAMIQIDPRYPDPAASDEEKAKLKDQKQPSQVATNAAVFAAVAMGLVLGFLVFNVLPNFVAETLRFAGVRNGTAINYAAESIKVIFFLAYVWGLGFMPEIKRLYRFHGAEHKAINALEAEQPIDPQHCSAQTRIHPRCGTSFAIIVLIVGFLFSPLVPRYPITGQQGNFFQDVPVRLGLELLLLPIIAGVSYELLRFAGKMRNDKWVNIAFAPGMWTQLITTQEPDQSQVEVAIVALHKVLEAEGETYDRGATTIESSDWTPATDEELAALSGLQGSDDKPKSPDREIGA